MMAVPAQKWRKASGLFGLLLLALYLSFCVREYLASRLSESDEISRLQQAARLSPGDAEVHRRLGVLLKVQGQTQFARTALEEAARLNPYDARTQLDLAGAYQFLNEPELQRKSLERALKAAPVKPDVAWEAANYFLLRGDKAEALRLFRVVLANDNGSRDRVLDLAWRIAPDADRMIQDVLPPDPEVYGNLLEQLVSRKENVAAARIWDGLVHLNKPFRPRFGFVYVDSLLSQHQAEEAQRAWQQMAPLCGLTNYLPTTNLVVNPRFDHEILNAGFDWRYASLANIHLTLDPDESPRGTRSLLATFDGPGVSNVGLGQFLVVEPATDYLFSVHYKTDQLEGAGGIVFGVRDEVSGAVLFTSDPLHNPDSWRDWQGHFKTGAETRLVSLALLRQPAGDAIRGRLWIDDVQIVKLAATEAKQ